MLDTEDKIGQFLNSKVSYWDGLKSREFWKKFREKGELTFSSIYLLLALASPLTLVINPELDAILKVTLVLLSVSLLSSVMIGFKNHLRFFQLNKQLKIIEAAQKEQENKERSS